MRYKSVHWLVPTTMILALLTGTLLAMGHHLFYRHLTNHSAPTGLYHFAGKTMSKQQFNTAVGTAFAFLVKFFLTVAVSTAYVQIFWRNTLNAKEYPTLSELDCANSGLLNVFSLLNVKVWWKYPILLVLALIFWCVPLSSVFTPGTLSVENVIRTPPLQSKNHVPQFDFTSLDFVGPMLVNGSGVSDGPYSYDIWAYNGPSQAVQNIAGPVVELGEILAIDSPAVNATWSLDFWGPGLQCNDVTTNDREAIWTNIWNGLKYTYKGGQYVFLSWAPWPANVPILKGTSQIPENSSNRNLPFLLGHELGPSAHTLSTDGPASFYIAVLPQMLNITLVGDDPPAVQWTSPISTYTPQCQYETTQNLSKPLSRECNFKNISYTPATYFKDSTLLECNLVNRSYSAVFDYTNSIQDIRVTFDTSSDSATINTVSTVNGPNSTPSQSEPRNCSTLSATIFNDNDEPVTTDDIACVFDPAIARLLAYQGIAESFNQFLQGSVRFPTVEALSTDTSIMNTILAQTNELAFIRDWLPSHYDSAYVNQELHTVVQNQPAAWAFPGLANSLPSRNSGDLKSTIEQLFQSFAISLLAEPYLLPNYSSPWAPPNQGHVNVSLETYHNIYKYDWETLWISYGLAVLFTTLAVVAGVVALILNGVSYSDNFSTIVRVSRTADMSVEVMDDDGDGREPLPKYLKEARFDMHARSADEPKNVVAPRRSSGNGGTNQAGPNQAPPNLPLPNLPSPNLALSSQTRPYQAQCNQAALHQQPLSDVGPNRPPQYRTPSYRRPLNQANSHQASSYKPGANQTSPYQSPSD